MKSKKPKKVRIRITGRTFDYFGRETIEVKRGDKIEWTLTNEFPWGIVIKAPVSPFDWTVRMTGAKKTITARVNASAAPGHYPYAVGAWNGKTLLFDDPEIILRPPTGGRA